MKKNELRLLPVNLSLFDYNKDVDYSKKIAEAEAEGNYQAAALYEQQRNEKIAGENMNYEQTNKYSSYLNTGSGSSGGSSGGSSSSLYDANTDYSALLNAAMNAGSTDADYLQSLLNARMAKVQDSKYAKWADPERDAQIQSYINNIKNNNDWQKYIDEALAQINSMVVTPTYEASKFDTLKEQLAEKALNMDYEDWLGSEQYQALVNRYGLQGQQSMRDILGQVSSRTGGLASSYATSAAQQQYNDYMAQLEAAAQDMFSGEQQNALSKASAAYNYADADYQRYLDELAQSNTEKSYAYNLLSDAIANSQYEKEWAASQENATYQKNLEKAQTLAASGDFSGYRALGYSEDEIAQLQNAYNASLKTTSSANASSAKKSSSSKKTAATTPSFDDYSTAVSYMTSNGVPSANASGAMTKSEWTKRKNSYNQYGTGGAEVTNYDSYSDYLTAYVEYCLEQYTY